jgi:hypothetical protein
MTDGGKSFYLMPQGLTESLDLSRAFVSDAKLTFATPDWAKHAVWYQVFVERFRNGDKANDPGDKPYERLIRWQSDWWKTQPGEVAGAENFSALTFGGNWYLAKNTAKLSADLGYAFDNVTSFYAFEGRSNNWVEDAAGNDGQWMIRTQLSFSF